MRWYNKIMDTDAQASTLDSPVAQLGFLDPTLTVGYLGIKPGMKVADFGVGRGYYALELAKIVGPGGLVSGVDIVPTALDALEDKARNLTLENIRLVQANLEIPGASGLADNSQDFVLLANILFQVEKKDIVIAESQRVLISGGKLCIIDWRKGASILLGPPDQARISEDEVKTLLNNGLFEFEASIDAGSFHYGLIFKKK